MRNPPRRTRTTMLWIGVGAYALVAGSALPAEAEAQRSTERHVPSSAADQGGGPSHGGEAGARGRETGHRGEGGERGAAEAFAGAPPEVIYAARIALIRGHLAVGRELVEAGAWSEALPHFLHPTEEIYEDLAPALRDRGATAFRQQLEVLAQAVRARADALQIEQRYQAVEAVLNRAEARLPAATRDAPGFVGHVVAVVLRQAATEYDEAVEGGRIANAVEYQDSRGFVRTAAAMLRVRERALRAKDARAFGEVMQAVEQLARAWPDVRPPERPVLAPGEVSALVSRIELAAANWR